MSAARAPLVVTELKPRIPAETDPEEEEQEAGVGFHLLPDLRCAPLIVPAPRQIRVTAATDSVPPARRSASHARDGDGATGEQAQQETGSPRAERRASGDEGENLLRAAAFSGNRSKNLL